MKVTVDFKAQLLNLNFNGCAWSLLVVKSEQYASSGHCLLKTFRTYWWKHDLGPLGGTGYTVVLIEEV